MPDRHDFPEGNRRRDNPRNERFQNYNSRYNQGPRDAMESGGYGGHDSGNRSYNFQHGRNQEQRYNQHHQNISPDSRPQYYQNRNPDMRMQNRGMDYRGPHNKNYEPRQHPPYPK